MTPEAARSFGRYSIGNATAVVTARPCGCKPYEDVFTFRRWIALGFVVRKGETAIKLPVITDKQDEETGEVKRLFHTSAVFCRCQVKPLGDGGGRAPWVTTSEESGIPIDRERGEPASAAALRSVCVAAARDLVDSVEPEAKRPTPQIAAPWSPHGAHLAHDLGASMADRDDTPTPVRAGSELAAVATLTRNVPKSRPAPQSVIVTLKRPPLADVPRPYRVPGTYVQDRKCQFSFYMDRSGKRRGIKAHTCDATCSWTRAQCAEYVKSQPIFRGFGTEPTIPTIGRKTEGQRANERKIEREHAERDALERAKAKAA